MGLELWFAEDIRNALLAANEASAATAAVIAEVEAPLCGHPLPKVARITCSVCRKEEYYVAAADLLAVRLRAYREGYSAALATVALAFGISPASLMSGHQRRLLDGQTLPEERRI